MTVTTGRKEGAGLRLFRLYGLITLIVVGYYGALRLVGLNIAAEWNRIGGAFWLGLFLWFVYVAWVFALSMGVALRRSGNPTAVLRDGLVSREAIERQLSIFLMIFLIMLLLDTFLAWKKAIPQFAEYNRDPFLARIDRALHFGIDPWRWTHALPGRYWVTRVIDWGYVWLWWGAKTILMMGIVVWGDFRRRSRFLVAYSLAWIVAGTVMAMLLASGGPVYYGRFTGDEARFGELLAYLERSSPILVQTQETLWHRFGTQEGLIGGISAMPSLHVCISVLTAIWAWGHGGWVRITLVAYALFTFVASIHLGWHYAIDGYVAGLVALGCWWVAGHWVGRDAASVAGDEASRPRAGVSEETSRPQITLAQG